MKFDGVVHSHAHILSRLASYEPTIPLLMSTSPFPLHYSLSYRPRNSLEKKASSSSVVTCSSKAGEVIVKGEKTVSKTFTFDKVFDQSSTQMDVYREVVNPIISEVLQGYNCTVFA